MLMGIAYAPSVAHQYIAIKKIASSYSNQLINWENSMEIKIRNGIAKIRQN